MLVRRIFWYSIGSMLLLTAAFRIGPLSAQESAATSVAPLALGGYDPVAYFTQGQPVVGKPEFEHEWDEARYHLSSEKHLALFRADPDRYAPQFAGSCAMAMSKGLKIEAEPNNWLIVDGRLFVFAGPEGPTRFKANADTIAPVADTNWEKLKSAPNGSSLP